MGHFDAYLSQFEPILTATLVTGSLGEPMDLDAAVETITDAFIQRAREGVNKILFIGNGGSAGIASHQAFDYWKNGRLRTMSFNDPSLLTGSANDFGYAKVFAKPIAVFAQAGDLLMAISSSGSSPNIVNATIEARARGCGIITMSGFSPENPLRLLGDWNFYVPSRHYGLVEVAHLVISHSLLDHILAKKTADASARRIIGLGDVVNTPIAPVNELKTQ